MRATDHNPVLQRDAIDNPLNMQGHDRAIRIGNHLHDGKGRTLDFMDLAGPRFSRGGGASQVGLESPDRGVGTGVEGDHVRRSISIRAPPIMNDSP